MIQLRSQLVYMITLAVTVKTYKIILEKNFFYFTPLILYNTYFFKNLFFPKYNVL